MQSAMTKEQEQFHADRVRNTPRVIAQFARTLEMIIFMKRELETRRKMKVI